MEKTPYPRRLHPLTLLSACALLAGGCQLLVGDIDLPPAEDAGLQDAEIVDSGWDAEIPTDAGLQDASPADAAVDLDAEIVDGGWDAEWPDAELPDAEWPDAAPDAEPPAPEVAALAGQWHVYGVTEIGENQALIFEAVLVVAEGGWAAGVYSFDGEPLYTETQIMPQPGAPTRLRVNLFPVAGVLTGAVDHPNGVGVLVNDEAAPNFAPTFAVMVRAGAAGARQVALPYLARTVELSLPPQASLMAIQSTFAGEPETQIWVETDREITPPAEGGLITEPRLLGRPTATLRRWRFDPELAPARLLTASGGSVGVFGRLTAESGALASLSLGWSPSAGAQGQPFVPGLFYCGLVHHDDGLQVVGTPARLSDLGTWRWRTGEGAQVVREEGEASLQGDHPLFGPAHMDDLFDPAERVHLMRPQAEGGEPLWGAGLCVRVDEP